MRHGAPWRIPTHGDIPWSCRVRRASSFFAPIGAFLYLLIIRVSLELMVVIFRIGETQGQVLEALRGGGAPPRPSSPEVGGG